MSFKQILRNKYASIKKDLLFVSKDKASAYHYGLKQNLQSLIQTLLDQGTIKPNDHNSQLYIGTYLPIVQRQIIPPCLSQQFLHKLSLKTKYFTPSFTLENKSMHFVQFLQTVKKNSQFKLGAFGVKTPIVSRERRKVDTPDMHVLLVPLICVQGQSLQRIGYGGGYYDNYIKENKPKNTLSIGIALQSLVFNSDSLNTPNIELDYQPTQYLWDEWDQPLDFAITQTRIIHKK